ncbi:MAG: DDE-type integrase/transposase/recombinase [Kordiimonas sp.]
MVPVLNWVWLADITYVDTNEGWLYVAVFKDMATREIVVWAMWTIICDSNCVVMP